MNLLDYVKKIDFRNLNLIDEDLRELAIVRKLLLELSKIFYRDTTFFLNKENLQERSRIYNKKIKINMVNDFSIVCNTYSQIVNDLLNTIFKIQSELISPNSDTYRHVDIIITTASGKRYIVDPLMDLVNFQSGMRTTEFASEMKFAKQYKDKFEFENIAFLKEDEINKIDEVIGYKNGIYVDDFLNLISDDFSDMKNFLRKNPKLSAELLKNERTIINENSNKPLEQKLDIISLKIYSGQNFHSIADLIIYIKKINEILLSNNEIQRLLIKSFFIDSKDIKNKKLLSFFKSCENRKRGVMVNLDDLNYIYTFGTNDFLKLTQENWNSLVKENNIFIKEVYHVKMLQSMKNYGVDRNLLHHSEFLRLFSLIEKNSEKNNINLLEYVKLDETFVEVNYERRLKFFIENNTLAILDIEKNEKFNVEYSDEGRKINYIKTYFPRKTTCTT